MERLPQSNPLLPPSRLSLRLINRGWVKRSGSEAVPTLSEVDPSSDGEDSSFNRNRKERKSSHPRAKGMGTTLSRSLADRAGWRAELDRTRFTSREGEVEVELGFLRLRV